MANDGKFLNITSGRTKQEDAINSSAGAGDAGKLIKLDAAGLLDSTFIPEFEDKHVDVVLDENVGIGDVVQAFDDGGTLKVRKASAASGAPLKPMHGWMEEAGVAAETKKVHFGNGPMVRTAHGFTPGNTLWLSTTAGLLTATPPSGTGQIVQLVGRAIDVNTIMVNMQEDWVELA